MRRNQFQFILPAGTIVRIVLDRRLDGSNRGLIAAIQRDSHHNHLVVQKLSNCGNPQRIIQLPVNYAGTGAVGLPDSSRQYCGNRRCNTGTHRFPSTLFCWRFGRQPAPAPLRRPCPARTPEPDRTHTPRPDGVVSVYQYAAALANRHS